MKNHKIKISIIICIISIIIITARISIGAVQAGSRFNTKGHIFNPNVGGGPLYTNEGTMFCCEEGGELKSQDTAGDDITHYYYFSSSGVLAKKIAYALDKADNAGKQRIIWNSNLSDNIGDPPKMTSAEKALVDAGKAYKNATGGNTSLLENPGKAKTENINNEDYYVVGPIKVDFDSLGTEGKIENIEVFSESTKIETITTRKSDANLSTVESKGEFNIKLLKSKYEGIKEVKIKINLVGHEYTGTYTEYYPKIYYDSDNSELRGINGQNLIKVEPKPNDVWDSVSFRVKLTRPRIITTKYLKKIEHENGSIYTITDSWKPEDWEYQNQKPTVKVNEDEDVDSNKRYELTKQNTNPLNITYGDIITYDIRLYNVGNGDADFTDTELELEGMNEPSVLKKNRDDGYYYIYDNPDDNIEFVEGNGWESASNGSYKINASRLGTIGNYEEHKNDGNVYGGWSIYIPITFKVLDKQATKTTIVNNGNEIPRNDTGKKFLYSFTYTDADKNQKEYKCEEPIAKIDSSVPVGDKNRITYSFIEAPTVTMQDQSKVTYCVRYYSIGINSTKLTYEFEDNFGEGLEFVEAKDKNGNKIDIVPNGRSIFIPPPNVELPGYNGGEIPYYDVYLTFNVNLNDRKDIKILRNKLKGNPDGDNPEYDDIKIVTEYKIKGRVFIDNQDLNNKTTIPRDEIWSEGSVLYTKNPDEPVQGIRVQLLNKDGSKAGDVINADGTSYIKDPQTEELYPTFTYTDENGEYTFEHLRSAEFWQKFEDGKLIDEGSEDYSKPYKVEFTYNGQEYENIHYNSDSFKGNGSYATEGNENRSSFNNKFTTINSESSTENSKNSTEVSLQQATRRAVTYIDQGFEIKSYTGSNGEKSEDGLINADTSYIEHVNLGLVKRTFSLALQNQLDSMDVYINGDKTTLKSYYGESLQEILNNSDIDYDGIKYAKQQDEEQEVYFKESDYSYQDTDANKELQVRVNYKVTVYNNSPDKFIGILNAINLHYDNRFNDMKVTIDGAECDTISISSAGNFQGSRITLKGGKKLGNTADDNKVEIKISFLLNRKQIADAILASDTETLKTLEMIAEIESYGSEYNGDTFNNGHTGNAGKIDENSDSGNFDINDYIEKKKDTEHWNAAAYFNKEDDCHRATIIKLKSDDSPRTLEGIVFEDATEKTSQDSSGQNIENGKTRLGDGEYKEGEKPISGVSVKIIDTTNLENNTEVNVEYGIRTTITADIAKQNNAIDNVVYETKTDESGKYTLSGFIPSTGYIIQFTYGDGNTSIYNAQDYKSTIDKTELNYETHTSEAGNKYGWYSDVTNKTDSVAKDTDMKMDESLELTNESAQYLENYKNAGSTETLKDHSPGKYFENTAVTAEMYVGLRWEGNSKYTEETYNIKNINLGLAERPRAELTLTKEVDHISIVATDGSTIVDGTVEQKDKDGVKSISWTSRYVQPIIDENLIFGSTMKVTYKFKIENTGEVDYYNKTANNSIGGNGRTFYDYGKTLEDKYIVTTKPTSLVDYVDNKLIYDEETESYNNNKNSKYWKILLKEERIGEGLQDKYDEITTILKLGDGVELEALKPGEGKDNYIAYLTFEKVLSDAMAEDLLTYNNYAEITGSINSAGRRSYSTWETDDSTDTNKKYYLLSDIKYKDSSGADKGNVGQRGIITKLDTPEEDEKNKDEYVLTIPGNLNPVNAYKGNWSTLYDPVEEGKPHGEPDSDQAQETQIIQPFGASTSQKILIWTITGTIAGLILAGGIYLIKKKVL